MWSRHSRRRAAEEAFADGIQVGRFRRDRDHVVARAVGGVGKVAAEFAVVVPDQEPPGLLVGCGFPQLLGDPGVGRGAGDVDMHDFTTAMPDDDEGEERAEPGVIELEEVAGPDVGGVVPEKCPPGLAPPGAGATGPQVLLDRPLADPDAELQELAADPLSPSERVGDGYGSNQLDDLRAQASGAMSPSGVASPEEPEENEEIAMPAQERIGLDEMKGVAPRGVDAGEQHQDKAVLPKQARSRRGRPSQHENLLSQECVLGHQIRARPNGVEGGGAGECGRGANWSEQGLDDLAHSVTATLDGAGHSTDPTVQHPNLLPSRRAGP